MIEKKNIKVEGGKRTAGQIIKIARKLFSELGYANTSIEKIVHEAGVTRGALYHHFSSKKELFMAVFEDAQRDILERNIAAIEGLRDSWEKFTSSGAAFIKACLEPEIRQIVLIDAPAIIGWDEWRGVDEKGVALLRQMISNLLDEGLLKPLPLEALTHIISGATNEAVLWISRHKNQKQARSESGEVFNVILNALRAK